MSEDTSIKSVEEALQLMGVIEEKVFDIAHDFDKAGLPDLAGLFYGVLALVISPEKSRNKLITAVYKILKEEFPENSNIKMTLQ